MRVKPVENHRVPFADVDHPQRVAFGGRGVEYLLVHGIGEFFEPGKIGGRDFEAGDLGRIPAVEPLDIADVGKHHHFVQFIELRVVNAFYAETVPPRRILDKEHFERVAHPEFQHRGEPVRNEYVFVADRVGEDGNRTFGEILPEKRPVVVGAHPFQHDALHRLFAAQDARFDRVRMNFSASGQFLDQRHDRLVFRDRDGLVRGVAVEVDDLHMRAETGQLRRDFVLETEDHRQRNDHHGHAYGYAQRRDADHHVVFAAAAGKGNPPGEKVFQVDSAHRCCKIEVSGETRAK